MRIVAFGELEIPRIAEVMAHGRPWLPEGSDYWFFKRFHGATSFAACVEEVLVGGIVACVDAGEPPKLYIDQVAVDPSFRGQGIVQQLFHAAEEKAKEWGCAHAWLSTDPGSPGKDRALFEKRIG